LDSDNSLFAELRERAQSRTRTHSINLEETMTPEQQTRYSRQIKLPQVGEAGQERLLKSRALIIGIGGLGSPVSMYLAAAGVGGLVLTDYDQVDSSNLQRQIVHTQANLGELKATSARETLLRLNPEVSILALDYELDGDELIAQAEQVDVLVDCTDNFPSRFEINRVSLATGTPLVSGAAIRWEGQVSTFIPKHPSSPCYQCLYPDTGIEAATCEMEGVIAPLVGIVGSIQALEVLNLLLKTGDGLNGRLLILDSVAMEWQAISLPRNPDCPACSRQ
jgi:adenylyltransferase/sulfurtransferase